MHNHLLRALASNAVRSLAQMGHSLSPIVLWGDFEGARL